MFLCFEGDISEDEIVETFQKILKGDLLLKKEKDFEHRLQSMHEYATDKKLEKKLKGLIVEYLSSLRPEDFIPGSTWDFVCEKLPVLLERAEFQRLCRSASDNYLKDCLRRNKENEALPITFTGRLDNLCLSAFRGSIGGRAEPFVTLFSENLLMTVDPSNLQETAPQCPLALVDFARVPQHQWSDLEIFVLLEYISRIPKNHSIVVAFWVLPGILNVNVHQALNKLVVEKMRKTKKPEKRYFQTKNKRPQLYVPAH